MKRCPGCNRVESDESLAFCCTDESALVTAAHVYGEEVPISEYFVLGILFLVPLTL